MPNTIKIGINGMGVLGRQLLRTLITAGGGSIWSVGDLFDIEITQINDPIVTPEMLKYLLMTDTVYGNQAKLITNFDIKAEDNNTYKLDINGTVILYTMTKPDTTTPDKCWGNCTWGENDIDVVIDCVGNYLTEEQQESHVKAGARKVLSCETNMDIMTTSIPRHVHGVTNASSYIYDGYVFSCPSGDAIGMSTLMRGLQDFGVSIDSAIVEYINSYTNLNNLQDSILKSLSDSQLQMGRAGAWNIISCNNNLAKAIGLVIPELNGKCMGIENRCGTIAGSHCDVIIKTSKPNSWDADSFTSYVKGLTVSDLLTALEHSQILLQQGVSKEFEDISTFNLLTTASDVIGSPFVFYDSSNYNFLQDTSESSGLLRVGVVYDAISLQIANITSFMYLFATM